ncbi:MAG: PilZ domain-containing protein [Omnitrophica bacterium]|nr:PilZ domain-containing protein [Candidatus Omnitrophota bacterium]
MEIRQRFEDNTAILYITGKIDINSALLIEKTGQLLREGVKKILCNFTNVRMVDYNGLSLLAITYKNAINQKGAIKFCCVPVHIKQLFEAAKLEKTFEIYPDEKSAIKGFDLSNKVDKLPLRRRFKRIDVSIPIKYKVGLSASNRLLKGKILNVSGEGLYIFTENTYPVSSEIYMEIEFGKGSGTPLTLMGTVIWLADKELQPHAYPGMGVTFSNLDTKAQNKIIDFIDKNLTSRSKA